ncbi:MAG: LPS export ABC transporter permease LptF [Gammaproteobacteria bacterium]|nr:LPS export ABC transporter permease LptF [Gammaproteobacteria bacterium]
MFGVFDRYVARQTLVVWAGVTAVLVAIVVVNRFAVYLGQAAAGEIPGAETFVLLGLSVLSLLEVVIPVSLFLAVMLTLGRLYRDSEATVAWACGLTPARLYRPFAVLAVAAAILLAVLALYVSPWAKSTVHRISMQARATAQVSVMLPGRFKTFADGRGVFYAGGSAAKGQGFTDVFSALRSGGQTAAIVARRGRVVLTPSTGERHLKLDDGLRYAGTPGRLDWTVTRFSGADLVLQPPQVGGTSKPDLDRLSTAALFAQEGDDARAALAWRVAQPFTVLVLILIALPLAHTRPRRGRYARLVPAILFFIVYFNLLGIARVWVADGNLPTLAWVPALGFAAGLVLLWRQYGRRRILTGARHDR